VAAVSIDRAAVVGAGTMGAGIAIAYATAGIPVLLKDADATTLATAIRRINSLCEASVARGKMTTAAMSDIMAAITPTTEFEGFEAVDIVTEAVFENMTLKRAIFAELGAVTRADCVLSSNTSTLDIDAIAEASGRPECVIGLHFFCPANVMKLIEVVRGATTTQQTVERCLTLARRLGKAGIVVGNSFGFVANRMFMHYMREAYLLVEEGCSVQQVDAALVGFGLPMGPFGVQDLVGLDVGARIRRDLKAQGKTMVEGPQSELPDRLFELGRYGRKTRSGWYKYDSDSGPGVPDPVVDDLANAAAARRGARRRSIDDEEIVGRTVTALINEGARLLEARLASSAGDIDQIYVHGFGFPARGPMRYADTVGLEVVLTRLRSYEAMFGAHWRPSPMLERLVAEDQNFYDVM
jgi:3-hydroxyacyl-CoA dehydrogenase